MAGSCRRDSGWKRSLGRLPGFAMTALVGDFVQPLAGLRVHIGQIGEGAQRPEVLAHITDRPFDFTFVPGRRPVTGARDGAASARKGDEAGTEADQGAG